MMLGGGDMWLRVRLMSVEGCIIDDRERRMRSLPTQARDS